MALTRPTVAQLNTVVTEISDPVTVLNKGSTQANVDVGFVLNRDGGISPNVAIYWNETADSIVAAYTTSAGGANSNIALTSYANLTIGNVIANGNITTVGGIFVGNITGKTNGFTIGYLEMPQVASGNVTLALSDSGKHFYNTTASPQTITVPTFANVAFGNGTVISIANQSTSNISVALQSAVILYLAGNATSAARTITSYGVATLLKVNTNTWFINGSGVA